MIIIIF